MNENLHLVVNDVHQTQHRTDIMLRISTEKKRCKVLLTVEGRLAGQTVPTLEQFWRELRSASPQEKYNVDLCGVTFIDAAGKALLKQIHNQGARLTADGCLNQEIIKEITEGSEGKRERSKRSHIIFYMAFFSLLVSPARTEAQEPQKPAVLPATAPSGSLRLTLDQAVALALKQNTTAQIAVLTAA